MPGVTGGQKIVYVTDIGFTPENVDQVVALPNGADLFLIGTPYSW